MNFSELSRAIDQMPISDSSKTGYVCRMKAILKISGFNVKSTDDVITALMDYDKISSNLKKTTYSVPYYQVVWNIRKHLPDFEVLPKMYETMFLEGKEAETLKKKDRRLNKKTVSWESVSSKLLNATWLHNVHHARDMHRQAKILGLLYYHLPLRDIFASVRLHTKKKIFLKTDKTNSLCLETGRLRLATHKISHSVGTIYRVVPEEIMVLIKQSLEVRPRDWLFFQKDADIPYQKMNTVLKKHLDTTITEIRHAYASKSCTCHSSGGTAIHAPERALEMNHSVAEHIKSYIHEVEN